MDLCGFLDDLPPRPVEKWWPLPLRLCLGKGHQGLGSSEWTIVKIVNFYMFYKNSFHTKI